MVIKQTGDIYQYEGMTYIIGKRIYTNGQSDWEGLFGVITEIRTNGDKETENETPDIYCSFDVSLLPADVKELEERFSNLYREPKKLEDISLDEVIMAPKMIEAVSEMAGNTLETGRGQEVQNELYKLAYIWLWNLFIQTGM